MHLSKTNDQAREAAAGIAEIAGVLWDKGWAEASAGNISLNVTENYPGLHLDFRTFPMLALKQQYPKLAGSFIFITAKGSRFRHLANDPGDHLCLIKVSQAGDGYQLLFEDEKSPNQPSSEILSHLAIHNMMIEQGGMNKAIVHTHPHDLVVLTHNPQLKDERSLNNILLKMHTETAFFMPKGIGYIPFKVPGSQAMADATLKKLCDCNVVLWEKHGCMAIGEDAHQAFDRIDMMAKAAQIYLTAKAAGFDAEGISDRELDSILNQK
jgi:rhamnulose-1-phosphate aldolase